MTKKTYIDVTPKWEALILPMLQAYENTDQMEVRKNIIKELKRLAKIVDNLKEVK